MSPAVKSVLLVLVLAVSLLASRVSGQGLYPPQISPGNFAFAEAVTATSTCGGCEEGAGAGCGLCNNTCPFGDGSPVPLNLMEIGTLQAGVVSLWLMYSIQLDPFSYVCA